MTESPQIRTEVDGRVLKIVVDNVRKKNAFVPEMMVALADALTVFDRDDELWVAVLCAAGEHTTAGLDMPKFFGPTATPVEPAPDAAPRASARWSRSAASPRSAARTSVSSRARAGATRCIT